MRQSDYGILDRWLHYCVLAPRFVRDFCLDLSCAGAASEADVVAQERHLFICGLARSGSTILLRNLHATGQFGSLCYCDMPFVLFPKVWKQIRSVAPGSREPRERAHGDGILVDAHSPEAFEEVFWLTCEQEDYVREHSLIAHEPPEETLKRFCKYIAVVLENRRRKSSRYLSKNNNNVLRLTALRRALPESMFIIPFREPEQQAYSLLKQHQRFLDLHGHDDFARDYMSWLGHFEFGVNHRAFALGDCRFEDGDPAVLDYWLIQWKAVYGHLLSIEPASLVFLSYDELCGDDGASWERLLALAGLEEGQGPAEEFVLSRAVDCPRASRGLLEECRSLHRKLLERVMGPREPRVP